MEGVAGPAVRLIPAQSRHLEKAGTSGRSKLGVVRGNQKAQGVGPRKPALQGGKGVDGKESGQDGDPGAGSDGIGQGVTDLVLAFVIQ